GWRRTPQATRRPARDRARGHLGADEDEDRRERVAHVAEAFHHAGEEEVEDDAAQQAQDDVPVWVSLDFADGEPHSGGDQEGAENVDRPCETLEGIIFDATVIRALLVPRSFVCWVEANWWMPRWMRVALRIHDRERLPNSATEAAYRRVLRSRRSQALAA